MEGRECGAQPRPPQADDTSEARVFRRSRNGLRLFPRLSQNSQREKAIPAFFCKFRFPAA